MHCAGCCLTAVGPADACGQCVDAQPLCGAARISQFNQIVVRGVANFHHGVTAAAGRLDLDRTLRPDGHAEPRQARVLDLGGIDLDSGYNEGWHGSFTSLALVVSIGLLQLPAESGEGDLHGDTTAGPTRLVKVIRGIKDTDRLLRAQFLAKRLDTRTLIASAGRGIDC